MSGFEIAALVVVAVWLALLTLGLVLVIQQLALLSARIERAAGAATVAMPDDGPPLGRPLPEVVLQTVPALRGGAGHLVLLAATCSPCRELAADLRGQPLPAGHAFVALVPGREHLADGVVDVLPPSFVTVRDPDATEIAAILGIEVVPFALTVRDGTVVAKAPPLDAVADLVHFLGAADAPNSNNGREPSSVAAGGGDGRAA